MSNTYINVNENDITHVPNDIGIYTSIYNDIAEFNNINYIVNDIINEIINNVVEKININSNINNMNEKINVDEIKNIVYVGDIIPKNTLAKGKWKLEYKCSKEIKNKENGRIYFIVINNEIYKIGSSSCKGGIKNTFSFYEGGLGGSPSIRTFGIHILIQNELNLGKSIKIYALFNEEIKVIIQGITSCLEKITYPDIKVMEDLCRIDYKKIYGKYPAWNFQENVEEWPEHIKLVYKEQVNNR